jgi:hypothetical protein
MPDGPTAAPANPGGGAAWLELRCDGQAMVAERPGPGLWRVAVPAGTRALLLASPAVRPSLVFGTGDARRLGVLVQRITVAQAGRESSLALDDPGLDALGGFHPAELVDGHRCRWTDGAAAIPIALLGDPAAAMVVTLRCFLLPVACDAVACAAAAARDAA